MIKKHLITCSVMLGLLITAKMFIFSATPETNTNQITLPELSQPEVPTVTYIETLSFAHEPIPAEDAKVEWRMKSMLAKHNFDKLQTNKLHQKASKWFPVIEPLLKLYGIPQDFKYVPLVESGLASGTSPKGASGYWQFMPQTARDYGLTVNSEVDERQYMKKSTIAACRYIKELYKEFDSWTLAAAAYNIGENSLKRQIKKQNEDNYFRMRLNRETATYVYKLISMKEIIERPGMHGFRGKYAQRLAKVTKPKAKKIEFNNLAADNELLEMQTFVM